MVPIIGQIIHFAGDFAPRGWALCHGQLLPLASNQAIYSVLGTIYGGDGKTTFALPDLRGRMPIGFGQGPGLSSRELGERSGVEQVPLLSTQLPRHAHAVRASASATTATPRDGLWAPASKGDDAVSAYGTSPSGMMSNRSIAPTGAGQPHPNVPPYQALNYIIALEGYYPSRS